MARRNKTEPLPTPADVTVTPIRRVLGGTTEILEGYGTTRLNEVVYVPPALATQLVEDGSGRFEFAHAAPAPPPEPEPTPEPEPEPAPPDE